MQTSGKPPPLHPPRQARHFHNTTCAGGLISTLREMYREGGLGVMFRGYATNMLLCINPAIEFTLFDQLKNIALERTHFNF